MRRFYVAYYYSTPQDRDRIKAFQSLSGDNDKVLISQFVRGWIGRNRDYFLELGKMDANARGMSFRAWGETVLEQGWDALPAYKHPLGQIPPNPLQDVRLGPDATVRMRINYLGLGVQNVVLLRCAVAYDRDSLINYLSRIVKEHLDRNWQKLYEPQVLAEDFSNWED